VLTVAVTVIVLTITGALAAVTPAIFDPGALVRYGLPVARGVHDLAAAATVGLLVLAAWFVGPEPKSELDVLSGSRSTLVRAAQLTATAWLASGLAVLVLTAADVTGTRVGSIGFVPLVISFVSGVDLGRALGASLLVVALVATLSAIATRVVTVAWAAALSLLALLPLALGGHASGAANHMNAVDSLALHLLAVCCWVGGLMALLLVSGRLGDQLSTVVRRYSTLALWCFVVVAGSGVVNAALRLGAWSNLSTYYGLLVVGKAVGLTLLGVAGWAHRRSLIGRLEQEPRLFTRLATVEVLVMAATMGLAVALSRSAPPIPTVEPDPVAVLLGYPAPPPLTLQRYFTTFYPETLWLAVAAVALGLYAAGVVRLRRRHDGWPLQRVAFWMAGCAALVFVTSGGPAVYGRMQFSAHMVQHMSLMVAVPLLLVFGAPVTLALRALEVRRDGSFGPREMLLRLVHSRILGWLGHPVVAAFLFTSGLVAFYYTGLFELAMFTHTGHVLMTAHFLLTGYLFVWALVGIDPGPKRLSYPFRLLLLLVTLSFHAFFGISLMASNSVLAPSWWAALGQTDQAALLADQQAGGSIAWAAGDIPSLFLGLALLVGWVRSDGRERRRLDRQADRDGDAELRRYNERLAALARRDEGG
jgi:putative copper resistance protein D